MDNFLFNLLHFKNSILPVKNCTYAAINKQKDKEQAKEGINISHIVTWPHNKLYTNLRTFIKLCDCYATEITTAQHIHFKY